LHFIIESLSGKIINISKCEGMVSSLYLSLIEKIKLHQANHYQQLQFRTDLSNASSFFPFPFKPKLSVVLCEL